MISKGMYEILSCMPRNHDGISYDALIEKCTLTEKEMMECFAEVDIRPYHYYRRTTNCSWQNSTFYLSENGLAEVEEYERILENNELSNKNLKIAKLAFIAAFVSAVAAIIAVIPSIIEFFQ